MGEPIPPERVYIDVPRAPNWACWQREGVDRLTEIIHWWIDATARSERGKPAGVIPAPIQWPSGEPAGRSNW